MLQNTSNNELLIISGPNGSGKTTFAKELLKESEYEYLSADEIAYELNPENPLSARLEAGKEFFRRLDYFAKKEKMQLLNKPYPGNHYLTLLSASR